MRLILRAEVKKIKYPNLWGDEELSTPILIALQSAIQEEEQPESFKLDKFWHPDLYYFSLDGIGFSLNFSTPKPWDVKKLMDEGLFWSRLRKSISIVLKVRFDEGDGRINEDLLPKEIR